MRNAKCKIQKNRRKMEGKWKENRRKKNKKIINNKRIKRRGSKYIKIVDYVSYIRNDVLRLCFRLFLRILRGL